VKIQTSGYVKLDTPGPNLPEIKATFPDQSEQEENENGDYLQIRVNLNDSLKYPDLELARNKNATKNQNNERLKEISSSFKQTNNKLNYFLVTVGVCVLLGALLRYVKNKSRESEAELHNADNIVDSADVESTDIMQIFKS
jgi:hypothetical protein